ncbi:DmpA L-aminopeptidase/D-esterase [Rhabdaerophilaceae bacterium]
MHNDITDIAGLSIGHSEAVDAATGVTAILFHQPAVASVAIMGGAPGGRDTALLDPDMTVETVDAIVLSGGSAFGLDAAGGAQAALLGMGRGLAVGAARVPIVPQAIIFDLLNGGNKTWGGSRNSGAIPPYWALGKAALEAAANASPPLALGSVGAGLGATTANLKGGVGSASASSSRGHMVAALVVVNAIGTATMGHSAHFWAAPYECGTEFGGHGWPSSLSRDMLALHIKGHAAEPATTIGLVATDAALTKPQAKRLAIMAHDGLSRAIRPAHAPMDGDMLFAATTGARPLTDPLLELTELGLLAGDCVARAIARGVFEAKALPFANALPDWKSRFG